MAPLTMMLMAWLVAGILNALGILPFPGPLAPLRVAFTAMFVMTGVAHFTPGTRREMARMVPSFLPAPGLLVALTGLLELLGAVGLLVPRAVPWAALGLAGLLVAMFPANVYAARERLEIAGREAMPLAPRLALQLFWITLLLWIAWAWLP